MTNETRKEILGSMDEMIETIAVLNKNIGTGTKIVDTGLFAPKKIDDEYRFDKIKRYSKKINEYAAELLK